MRNLFTFLMLVFTTQMFAQQKIDHYKHTFIARTTATEMMRSVNDSNDTTYLLTFQDMTYKYATKYCSTRLDKEQLEDFTLSLIALLADMNGEASVTTISGIRINKFKFMGVVQIGLYDKDGGYMWLMRKAANKFAEQLKIELFPTKD